MLSHQRSRSSPVPAALLQSLSDPDFRQRLEADPVGALAQEGVEISASEVPDEIRLPSAEALTEYFAAGPGTPGSNDGNGQDTFPGGGSDGGNSLRNPPVWICFLS